MSYYQFFYNYRVTVGTARYVLAGASVGGNGMFYGGYVKAPMNKVTRIDVNLTLVGTETNLGTARYNLGGAGV